MPNASGLVATGGSTLVSSSSCFVCVAAPGLSVISLWEMKYVLLSLGLCLQEKNSHFFHTEEQMNIQQVATSTDHRHREFAGRVLEDDLALWACFLYPMEQMIKARGGSVRPRVEFSERQARLRSEERR